MTDLKIVLPIALSCLPVSVLNLTELDVNGLPRLPFSVICYSRIHYLRRIRHPNLCRYLDAIRRKGELIYIISEHYLTNLENFVCPVGDSSWIIKRLLETLMALKYMDEHGLVHSFLSPASIMLDLNGCVKLGGYGLCFAIEWGYSVDYSLIHHIYSAPEILLFMLSDEFLEFRNENSPHVGLCPLRIESDVWSVGLVFLEILHGKHNANPLHDFYLSHKTDGVSKTINHVLKGFIQSNKDETLIDYLGGFHTSADVNSEIFLLDKILRSCLKFDVLLRPSPRKLIGMVSELIDDTLKYNYLSEFEKLETVYDEFWTDSFVTTWSKSMFNVRIDDAYFRGRDFISNIEDLTELYCYWKLAGGDNWLKKQFNQICNSQLQSNYYTDDASYSLSILKMPHYLAIQTSSSRIMCSKECWPSDCIPEQLM